MSPLNELAAIRARLEERAKQRASYKLAATEIAHERPAQQHEVARPPPPPPQIVPLQRTMSLDDSAVEEERDVTRVEIGNAVYERDRCDSAVDLRNSTDYSTTTWQFSTGGSQANALSPASNADSGLLRLSADFGKTMDRANARVQTNDSFVHKQHAAKQQVAHRTTTVVTNSAVGSDGRVVHCVPVLMPINAFGTAAGAPVIAQQQQQRRQHATVVQVKASGNQEKAVVPKRRQIEAAVDMGTTTNATEMDAGAGMVRSEEVKRTEEIERTIRRREKKDKSSKRHRRSSASAVEYTNMQAVPAYYTWSTQQQQQQQQHNRPQQAAMAVAAAPYPQQQYYLARTAGYQQQQHAPPPPNGHTVQMGESAYGVVGSGGANRNHRHSTAGSITDSLRRGQLVYGPNGEVYSRRRSSSRHSRSGYSDYNGPTYDSRRSSVASRGGPQPVVELPPTLPRHGVVYASAAAPPPPPPHRHARPMGTLQKSASFGDWADNRQSWSQSMHRPSRRH